MQDEFINRLTSFTTALDYLDLPDNLAIWQGQSPAVFETKVGEAKTMVSAIQDDQKKQETDTTGAAEEKLREEDELEELAYVTAQSLVLYYRDRNQETEAAELDLTPSEWSSLRDQALLAKAQLVIDQMMALSSGTSATQAAQYGITPAVAAALAKERKDYDEIVNAPAVEIAIRKALTKGFRPAINLTEKKFKDLDKLILQFRGTEAGKTFMAGWKNARIVKDAGHTTTRPTPPLIAPLLTPI